MDIHINEMSSTVRVADSEAILHPQVIERFMQMIIAKLKEHQKHERDVKEEQKMRPSMTSRETTSWE